MYVEDDQGNLVQDYSQYNNQAMMKAQMGYPGQEATSDQTPTLMNPADATLFKNYNTQMQKIETTKQVDELNFEDDEEWDWVVVI